MNRRPLILIFLVFLGIKLGVSFDYTRDLFCRNPETKSGHLTAFIGDSFSYTGAMENYITEGDYYFEFNGKKVYAGRVPHYSVPYYLFRQVFNKGTALDLFIMLQLVLEAVAFFLVSLIIFEVTKSKLIFFASLLFSAATYFYTHYTLIPITDSPAASLLLISFWFLYRYLSADTPRSRDWIFFSVILAMATILRPYFGLIFIFVAVLLLFKYKFSFTPVFKKGAVYGTVLLLLLAPWIIRNYNRSGKIILFQQDKYAGYDVSKELVMIRKMLAAIGEDASTMWDNTTAAGYFSPNMYKSSTWQVPPEIKADTILAANFFAIRNLSIDSIDDKAQSSAYTQHYHAFINQYKKTNKLNYYFLKYVNRIKGFLIHSGSYYYAYNEDGGCSNKINYYTKVLQSLFYYLSLVPGLIGLIWLACVKRNGLIFLLPTIALIIIFPIALGLIEWRYFLPFYFFHQIGLFYLLHRTLLFLKIRI